MFTWKSCRASLALIAFLCAAHAAWALGEGLGQSKEELKLKYDVAVTDHGNGRVTVTLTLADEGRLKPLSAINLVIPSEQKEPDGRSFDDLALTLATRTVDGKQVASFQLTREWAQRAEIQFQTRTLDGKHEALTWYYHTIPLAKYLAPPEKKNG